MNEEQKELTLEERVAAIEIEIHKLYYKSDLNARGGLSLIEGAMRLEREIEAIRARLGSVEEEQRLARLERDAIARSIFDIENKIGR